MRIPGDTELITFNGWTLRVRRALKQPARFVLLLHGWTGDENSMWVFVRNFPEEYWVVAPRGPYVTQPNGYSWRELHAGLRNWPSLEDLRPSADSLIPLMEDYAAHNQMDLHPFDVIGFSQGAALTNAIALLHPGRVRRLGVLSGFLPAGSESLMEGQPLKGKPFFVAHGTLDEMIDIEYARQSVALLERAGAQVTYCEDEIGHKLSANGLRALEVFFD